MNLNRLIDCIRHFRVDLTLAIALLLASCSLVGDDDRRHAVAYGNMQRLGSLRNARYDGDRLVECELDLYRHADGGRFFLDLDRLAAVFQTGNLRRLVVGLVICDGFRVLDLLPARLVPADI
jgi:hypothetical protein